ncbi:MAG: glycosyltransferase family 39 protein, partial [Chloroflexi bacterium]|nr:glycosyltransferase family 39 protein [Chloroflexota bacterium]
ADIPLNDDWAYAQSVRHLLTTSELHVSEWAAPSLIPQIYLGALFAHLAGGFSFVALRWSTLVCAVISCLALYDLLRQLGLRHAEGTLGVLLLLVNPIFINLTYTFMSDVFFLALLLVSLTCYARGFQRRSNSWLLMGGGFAALAYLERQIGLLLPVGAGLAWILYERRWAWRPMLLMGVAPALAVIGHQTWLAVIGEPWAVEVIGAGSTVAFITTPVSWIIMLIRIVWSATYLGIFTLPALVAWFVSRRSLSSTRQQTTVFSAWLIALGMPLAVFVVTNQTGFPQLADIINHAGLGAITLPGTKTVPALDEWFWGLTLIAPFAGAAQATFWTQAVFRWRQERRSLGAALIVVSTGVLLMTVVFAFFFDRYLLVLVPCAAYLVLRRTTLNRAGWLAAAAVSAALMGYIVIGMSDYRAWTTARWDAAEQLVAQGIAPENIDGGVEWVGWHEFEAVLPIARARGSDILEWMKINPKTYLLAFEPLPGYAIVKEVSYPEPFIDQTGHIFVLRRQ